VHKDSQRALAFRKQGWVTYAAIQKLKNFPFKQVLDFFRQSLILNFARQKENKN